MRPIKFRAWVDKDFEGEVVMFYQKEKTDRMEGDRKLKCCGGQKPQGVLGYFLEGNYPLMQFTGLLDKNGKEIYQGDIMEIPFDEKGKVFEVVWAKDGWWANGYSHFDWDLKDTVEWEKGKVIGNIYENPELLK